MHQQIIAVQNESHIKCSRKAIIQPIKPRNKKTKIMFPKRRRLPINLRQRRKKQRRLPTKTKNLKTPCGGGCPSPRMPKRTSNVIKWVYPMRAPVVYSRINFRRPFSLTGIAAIQPAGSYSIETRDRHYWRFPLSWEKKTKTTIRLHMLSGLQGGLHEVELDPRDLFRALESDRLAVAA